MEEFPDLMLIGGCVVSASLAVALQFIGQRFSLSEEMLSSEKHDGIVGAKRSLGRSKHHSKCTRTRSNSGKSSSAKSKPMKAPPIRTHSRNDDEQDISDLQTLASLQKKERKRVEKLLMRSTSVSSSAQKASASQQKKKAQQANPRSSKPAFKCQTSLPSHYSTTDKTKSTPGVNRRPKSHSIATPHSLQLTSTASQITSIHQVQIRRTNAAPVPAANTASQLPSSDSVATSPKSSESTNSNSLEDPKSPGSESLQNAFDLITHSGFHNYELQAIVGVATAQQDADAFRKNVQTTPIEIQNAAAKGQQVQIQNIKSEHQNQLETLKQNLNTLMEDLRVSVNRSCGLQSQLSQLSEESEALRCKNEDLHTTLNKTERCMKERNGQAKVNSDTIQTLKYELNIGQGQIFELDAKIERQTTEIQQLKQENTTLSQALFESKKGSLSNERSAESNGAVLQESLVSSITVLERDVEQLKNKNNELRKKNWGLTDSLNQTEQSLGTLADLEAEVEKKSTQIHDLKASNHSLKGKNAELYHRLDEHVNAASYLDELRHERNSLRREVDERDDQISRLETALINERELHVATEQECRNLIETQLPRSLSHIEAKHRALLEELQQKLDESDSRILQLQQEISESNRDRLYYDDQSNELEEKLSHSEKRYIVLVSELEQVRKAFETSCDQNEHDWPSALVRLIGQLLSRNGKQSLS